MQKSDAEETTRYADMLAALGAEPRLRIVRLLPGGTGVVTVAR
jgi:hypothetical protein